MDSNGQDSSTDMSARSSKTAAVLAWDPHQEKVVHINLVPEGFKGAECRVCGERLIAANRDFKERVKAFYFSHRQESDCTGEAESLAHMWAKQIIAEEMAILLPGYETTASLEDWDASNEFVGRAWSPERHVELAHVELEQKLTVGDQTRTPDITASLDGKTPLFIEIHITNPLDSARRLFYEQHNFNCFEIHVKDRQTVEWLELLADPDAFRVHVIEKAPREWAHCNLYPDAMLDAVENAKKQVVIARNARAKEAERRLARENQKAHEDLQKAKSRQEIVAQIERKLVIARQSAWREKRLRDYMQQVMRRNSKSAKISDLLTERYGRIPPEANVPVPDELAFWETHRCVWQWLIYEFLVIEPYLGALDFEARHGTQYWKKPIHPGGDIRPKNWVQVAPSFSKYRRVTPGDACRRIFKAGIKPSPLAIDVANLLGCGVEEIPVNKPRELAEISDQDWKWIPKPSLAVQHYLRALSDKGVLFEFEESYGSQGLGAFQLKGRETPPLA